MCFVMYKTPLNIELPNQVQTSDLVILQYLCFFIIADRRN